jgi:Holliday junction resolvase RusA-like endonuclease
MEVTITIPGEPMPKLRPRFRHVRTKAGLEFTQTYTPAKSVHYEKTVAEYGIVAMREAGIYSPFVGPIALVCSFRLPVPKSWSKKRTILALEGGVHHTSRPDVDNLVKSIKDACNGVIWKDDSQVVRLTAIKLYHGTPAAVVLVTQLDE